jgi:CheY-like chemotaxis protein
VISALRGNEALALSRLFRPDVLITDVHMPGVSGSELARELRQRHGNLCPLLIGVSGGRTHSDRLGQAAGFDHYLAKPYDVKQILGLLAAFSAPVIPVKHR